MTLLLVLLLLVVLLAWAGYGAAPYGPYAAWAPLLIAVAVVLVLWLAGALRF